jgi:hypothetical protein
MYIMKCKYEEKHFLHPLFKTYLRERAYAYNYAYMHYVFEFIFIFYSHCNREGDFTIILSAMGI